MLTSSSSLCILMSVSVPILYVCVEMLSALALDSVATLSVPIMTSLPKYEKRA